MNVLRLQFNMIQPICSPAIEFIFSTVFVAFRSTVSEWLVGQEFLCNVRIRVSDEKRSQVF